MNKTKFMEVMFSAVDNNDEELTEQVAGEIEAAKNSESGEVDLGEVTYINLGEGKVMVIDNVNQECTVVEGEGDEYEMEAMPDEEIEKYIHTLDGTTPDDAVHDGDVEYVEDHVNGGVAEDISNVNDDCMCSQSLNQNAAGASDFVAEGEEREFSVSTDNTAVLRFFSDQMFYERLMSEVIDSEESVKIGDIQIDKVGDDEVIITDSNSGDAAEVSIDGDELEVKELSEAEAKEFSALTENDAYDEEVEDFEQHEPMFVVGYDPDSHVVVDAPVYDEQDAQELAAHLSEMGVTGAQLFDDPDQAREYAHDLLSEEGAIEADEPVQAEFSERELYLTRYYSSDDIIAERIFSDYGEDYTSFMERVFSETAEGVTDSQDAIEDAIESGEQIENDEVIITPVDDETAVVEDKENGEFTKAVSDESGLDLHKISEAEAAELTDEVEIEGKEEEKEFSENVTRFMHKLFSEEDDDLPVNQSKIEDAIESGEQIEDEEVIITPIDNETAVVEDKKNDELTKVTLDGEDLDVESISEEEADELFEDIDVDNEGVDEDEEEEPETDEEREEREFSEYMEAYESLDPLGKFFADVADEMVTVQVPASALAAAQPVDDGGVDPMAAQAAGQAASGEGGPESVEMIEDKAIAAVNSIQEAAQQAVELIQEAKQAPAPGAESDIQEAQFSDRFYTDVDEDIFTDPMAGWLSQI